jgi:phosphate transport system substrate-binding protein
MLPLGFSIALLALTVGASAQMLKVNGSTTVNLVVAEAAEILRAEQRIDIQVDTQGGSAGGIALLGKGLVQIGMSSKHLGAEDRARYPAADFKEIHIGEDAVALVVSNDVWEGGVRALTRRAIQDIYEGRVTNWQQLGGRKQRIAFFNKELGRGTWEVFAQWLYGSARQAPPVSFPEVGGNEETRNKVGSTRGGLSQLSASWADGQKVHALHIKDDNGTAIAPSAENIANKRYPLSRPLFLLTNGEPQGSAKILIDFVLSDRGQELVKKHGYTPLKDLR